jgi:hypothetical protein
VIQKFPICGSPRRPRPNGLPEVRANDFRSHRIYAYRGQLDRKDARQGLDCSADTCSNHPSFMWSLPDNSGGEHGGATLSNIPASVFNSRQRCPIAQLKGSSRLLEISSCEVVQSEPIASRPCREGRKWRLPVLAVPYSCRFWARQAHNSRMSSGRDSMLAALRVHLRIWLEQRAKRRESLRLYRLTTRAARRMRV